MALQLVTPIIEQIMMACSQPFNHTVVTPENEDDWSMVIPTRETLTSPNEKIHHIQLCKIMNLPQQNFEPVTKNFKIKKNNQRSRRHHNIHQPGGSDCSQRR